MFQEIIEAFYSLPSSNLLADLPVYPADYRGTVTSVPFLKLNLILSKAEPIAYSNKKTVSGLVVVSIYYPSGEGQKYPTTVTTALDTLFESKLFQYGIQTNVSSLQFMGVDLDDKTLSRADYSVPFTHYGE